MAFSASSRDQAPRGIRRLLSMVGAAAVMTWFIARIGATGLARGVCELAVRWQATRNLA